MLSKYTVALVISAVLTALVTLMANVKTPSGASAVPHSAGFRRFRNSFLLIYYIAMTADWLQGPYVYALYSSYGFDKSDIAVLFVGGFGASMVFGTFAGAAADRFGRKRLCQLYCLLYIASCATKHAKDYWVLMLGRVLGGVATSLLFSSFESWVVCEHNSRGYGQQQLSELFSLMYFGNSLCAIVAGVVAEASAGLAPLTPTSVAPWHYGGYCSPFDLSAFCLVVCLVLITVFWNENYGAPSGSGRAEGVGSIRGVLSLCTRDARIPLLGAVVSLFEGSMYIFVFNWTPSFTASESSPPFGFIFATFMVACMGGSSLFSLLSRRTAAASILKGVFVAAAAALAVPIFSKSTPVVLAAFLLFEACVGLYWPAIGTVKSEVVPEDVRATVYNLFRVPLNGVVLAVLLNHMSVSTAFFWCTLMLLGAAACQMVLVARGLGQRKAIVDAADEVGSEGLIERVTQ